MTQVVNVYKDNFDVYIGRTSKKFGVGGKFANPYWMQDESKRKEVIEKFRIYLWKQIKEGKITKEELIALDGKKLGCYCSPKECHGDVIVKAIEWAKQN